MERRTLASPGLASSLTSSSDGRQRLISLLTGVSGSRARKRSSRESSGNSSDFSCVRSSARGSDCQQGADREKLRDPQGTSDFQTFHGTTHILHAAEGETSLPCGRASGHRSSPSGFAGSSPDHRTAAVPGNICFPISVEAYSVSWSMIFVYSRVFNAFSFMLW